MLWIRVAIPAGEGREEITSSPEGLLPGAETGSN